MYVVSSVPSKGGTRSDLLGSMQVETVWCVIIICTISRIVFGACTSVSTERLSALQCLTTNYRPAGFKARFRYTSAVYLCHTWYTCKRINRVHVYFNDTTDLVLSLDYTPGTGTPRPGTQSNACKPPYNPWYILCTQHFPCTSNYPDTDRPSSVVQGTP